MPWKWDMDCRSVQLSPLQIFITQDYHIYTMDILSCQPYFFPCLTLLQPLEHCTSF